MRFLRWPAILRLRLRSLWRRRRVEAEMDEELQFHLENQIEQYIAEGLQPDEARRMARLSIGGVEQRREEIRDARSVNFVEESLRDIRYSLRMLGNDLSFSTLAVLTLALGIGVNTAVFSLLNPVLFPSLPYPNAQELVRVFRTVPQSDSWSLSVPGYLDYRGQNKTFSAMAAFTWNNFSLARPGESAQRIQGILATEDYFAVLGVEPALGRVFTEEDGRAGAPAVVVLSDGAWRTRFGSDPKILGRTIRVDGQPASVIGVMPASFDNTALWGTVEMWRPFAFTDQQRQQRGNNFLNIVGRLKAGIPRAQADRDIKVIAAGLRQEYPDTSGPQDSARVASLDLGVARSWGLMSMAVTVFVLLIACVNLASLQLARTAARSREFAVRAALGGSRSRLIRQSLTESLLLSLIGCAVAAPVGFWSASIIYDRFIGQGSGLPGIVLEPRILTFAVLCAVLSAILFGMAPAFLAGRADVIEALKTTQRQATSSRGQRRFREGLVAAEITLVFVLLASAGLAIGGLRDAMHVERGWNSEHLLTAQLMVNSPQYTEPERRAALLDRLETRILALPGIQSVSFSTSPMQMWADGLNWTESYLEIEGRKTDPILAELEAVSPRFFETMHLRLYRGRTFNSNDRVRADVLIINERMAARLFPNENPIGKRLRNPPNGPWREIIGIVDDVRFPYRPVALPDSDLQAYRPEKGLPGEPVIVELRTAAPPGSLTAPLRQAVAEIDPDLPVFDVATGAEVIAQTIAPQSVPSMLLTVFAVLALMLAGVGIAGVISYSVAQGRAEIGIRMALGAQRRAVLGLILRQGARIIAIGTGLGLIGASFAVLVFAKLVPPLKDNATFAIAGATAILITVALAACYIPAQRASKLDPLAALRDE